jgi:hypothetical protein
MAALCLAAGALAVTLPLSQFTLAWMHSIEKIRWEEDWRVAGNHLVIDEARIVGSGAGMEPPPDAKLVKGVWHYKPSVAPLTQVNLAHSPFTRGYEICTKGTCTPLAKLLPGMKAIDVVSMRACGD